MPFPKPKIEQPPPSVPDATGNSGPADDSKDGTKTSGFVTAGDNQPPRECGNCRKFASGACQDATVTADEELGQKYGKQRGPDNFWLVDEDDCCDYFQSAGQGGNAGEEGIGSASTENGAPAIGVAEEQG